MLWLILRENRHIRSCRHFVEPVDRKGIKARMCLRTKIDVAGGELMKLCSETRKKRRKNQRFCVVPSMPARTRSSSSSGGSPPQKDARSKTARASSLKSPPPSSGLEVPPVNSRPWSCHKFPNHQFCLLKFVGEARSLYVRLCARRLMLSRPLYLSLVAGVADALGNHVPEHWSSPRW